MSRKTIRLSVQLWAEYSRQVRAGGRLRRRPAERWQAAIDALVVEHLGLVEKIARQVWGRFTRAGQNGYTSHIELADMVACGHIGLVEAARRYNPEDGDFPKFAFRRIRGAIIDAHRRGAYRDMQHSSIEQVMSETAEPRSAGQARRPILLPDPAPLPDARLAQREVEQLAVRAIKALPEDERVVIIDALRGTPLAETAAAQGRSVAWARQKLAAAREKVANQVRQDQRVA